MATLEPGQWAWVSDPDVRIRRCIAFSLCKLRLTVCALPPQRALQDYRLPAQILEFKRGEGAKVKLQDDSVRI
jgi:hypothetical protein